MTVYLILITSIVSIAGFYNPVFNSRFIFDPYVIKHKGEWWRFVTSGFLHGDWLHLFVNMFVLYSFGQAAEYYYGFAFGNRAEWMFLLLYLSGIFASNVSTYYKFQNHAAYRSLGASGAVSAVLFATILFNPFAKIYLYGIIGLPGFVMGLLYLFYSYYMSKKGGDQINHDAHFYGAVYGVLFTVVFKPALLLSFFRMFV